MEMGVTNVWWFVVPTIMLASVLALVSVVHLLFRNHPRLSEVSRKIVHLATAIVFVIGSLHANKEQMLLACIVMAAGLVAVSVLRIPLIMERVPRITIGAAAFPLGLAIACVLWYDIPAVFQFSVFALGFCDAVAAIIGTYVPFWRFRIFTQEKSVAGMVGCFLAGTVLALSFGAVWWVALIIGAALMITEVLFVFGVDNIFIPVIAGFLYMTFW